MKIFVKKEKNGKGQDWERRYNDSVKYRKGMLKRTQEGVK